MKIERPILFCGEMVKAILDGRKTQTRRVVKPLKLNPDYGKPQWDKAWDAYTDSEYLHLPYGCENCACDETTHRIYNPYGEVGGLLWVRETYGVYSRKCGGRATEWAGTWLGLQYKASEANPISPVNDDYYVKVSNDDWNKYRDKKRWQRWRSGRFMPKWAARIWLEITGVRVERVQEMSFNDWVADFCPSSFERNKALESFVGMENQKKMAAELWDKLNYKRGYPWSDEDLPDNLKTGKGRIMFGNPWVWVIKFKRIEK